MCTFRAFPLSHKVLVVSAAFEALGKDWGTQWRRAGHCSHSGTVLGSVPGGGSAFPWAWLEQVGCRKKIQQRCPSRECWANQETLENVKGHGWGDPGGGSDRRYVRNAKEEGLGPAGASSPIWRGAAAAWRQQLWTPGFRIREQPPPPPPTARSVSLGKFLSLHLLMGERGGIRKEGFDGDEIKSGS